MYVYMYMHMYMYISVYTYVYIYTHMYIYIHIIYTHTRTYPITVASLESSCTETSKPLGEAIDLNQKMDPCCDSVFPCSLA